MTKPMSKLLLQGMAQKLDSEFSAEDVKFFCEELVGRFPTTADLISTHLSFMIQDRDLKTVERMESVQ